MTDSWKFTADSDNRLLIFHEFSRNHLFTFDYMAWKSIYWNVYIKAEEIND